MALVSELRGRQRVGAALVAVLAVVGALTGAVRPASAAAVQPASGSLHTIVGAAASPIGQGYWDVYADGSILPRAGAPTFGDASALRLTKPIVGMAPTSDGNGYWLVASDGGIFAYGDAGFFGSMGGKPLTKPVVGMAAAPGNRGYWLVASDGGLFAFGNVGFFGSMGGKPLTKPVVGMAPTADGNGYWLVASDGGIFAFGDAAFQGSAGNLKLSAPVVGMAAGPDGKGYWLLGADGGIFNYGEAFDGSAAGVAQVPAAGIVNSNVGGYIVVLSNGTVLPYPKLTVDLSPIPEATVDQAYHWVLGVSGAEAPYTVTAASALAPGVSVSDGGLNGTPTQAGQTKFSLDVTDGLGELLVYTGTLVVRPATTVSVKTSSVPDGTVGQPYPATQLMATGGAPPYGWSASGLPDGLSLSASGVLSGTPTVATDQPFQVTVSDNYSFETVDIPLTVTTPGD